MNPDSVKDDTNGVKIEHLFDFKEATNITFKGSGEIDGQGYMWWVRELLQQNPIGRPMILSMYRSNNVEFSGISVRNSP